MIKKLILSLSLAALSFAAPVVPRPAGSVPFEVPGKGKDNLTNYKGKVVVFAAIIAS